MGVKAKHDEDAIFAEQVAELSAEDRPVTGRDATAFAVAFKGVFLEGLEVVVIVLTLGVADHRLGLAAAAVLGPLAAGLASWRRAWVHRLKAAEEECRAKTAEGAAWQSQLDDSRRTEEVVAKALAEART